MFLTFLLLLAADVKQSTVASTVKPYCIQNAALGTERCAHMLVPPDYDKSTERYPVLYLLHGLGDDHTAWSYMTNLSGYAPKYKIIMPDAGASFYVNSATDAKALYEDYLMKDFMPWVDKSFRTIPLPRSRAVAGLSMGGYGAAFLGLKHYRRFAALGAFSSAVGITRDNEPLPPGVPASPQMTKLMAMFGPNGSDERKGRDPFQLVEKIPAAEMPLIYIACGGQDFLIQQNREFVALLAKKNIPYEYREISPRGHTWDFWDDQIQVFLEFLKRGAKGFESL